MAFEAVTAKRGLIPTLPAAVAVVCALKSHRASVVGGTGVVGEGEGDFDVELVVAPIA
jgi:hypothetical protein